MLGGDFNIPLNPLQDTSTSKSSVAYHTLKCIKTLLHSITLIDSWRTIHPTGKAFTFYSAPHKKYTHIDYVFISQKDLPDLQEAHIGIQTFSDHSPSSFTIERSDLRPKPCMWRLNPSLLTGTELLPKITYTTTSQTTAQMISHPFGKHTNV